MIRLKCVLARMSQVALPDWLSNNPALLAQVYGQASGNDIQLSIVDRLAEAPLGSKAVVNAYRLHEATAKLTGEKVDAKGRATTIAVLFAGAYNYGTGVYGIMFDRGLATEDDPNSNEEYTRLPREACAIFLDTIRAERSAKADFEDETRFTTIHEMAHIFNLQHVNEPSYLASSQKAKVFGQPYFSFTKSQRTALALCSTSADVWPGGSQFGQTTLSGVANRPRRDVGVEGLRLSLGLPTDHFWPFEPIELDISLDAGPGTARAFRVPDRIDPGYEDFEIWIEQPNGERRLYRSPRLYCAYPSRRVVSADRPFRRDVSVFCEAAGFTFRQAGVHRIWAVFRARRDGWVRSEPVEFEVLPAMDTAVYRDARRTLGRRSASRLLYHRSSRGGATVRQLEDFVAAHGRWEGVSRVAYGLGRTLIQSGLQQDGARRHDRLQRGARLLGRALDRGHLGAHQAECSEELLGLASLLQ